LGKNLTLADGSQIETSHIGKATVKLLVNNEEKPAVITDVTYVPDLAVNLISIPRLTDTNKEVYFSKDRCYIFENDNIIATGSRHKNLFHLDTTTDTICQVTQEESQKDTIWHRRLGHPGKTAYQQIKNAKVIELPADISTNCIDCVKGKLSKLPFPAKSDAKSTELLGIVHSDLCGPMEVKSLGNNLYFMTFIDDKSGFCKIYFLKHKSDAFDKFIEYEAEAERQTGKKIKIFRSDGGLEYNNRKFQDHFKKQGIIHQTTVPYNPQQNGVAERRNRTIMEKARAMLSHSNLQKSYWAEAASTANYLINITPSSAINGNIPYVIWFNSSPNYRNLRVFGCKVLYHVPKQNRKKLDFKAAEGIFIGYGNNTKGYKIYDTSSRTIKYSRDVKFFENNFINSSFENKEDNSFNYTSTPSVEIDEETEEPHPPYQQIENQYQHFQIQIVIIVLIGNSCRKTLQIKL